MTSFSEAEELNAGAGLERRRAGRLAEAQRSPLGRRGARRGGLQRTAARSIQEADLKQIKAACFKCAVESEPPCLSMSSSKNGAVALL